MASRLLDRQARLLDHLSSAATLFGEEAGAPVDPTLQGIDRGLLRLEARFACNRRLGKIAAAFPRTFEILGADQKLILREFVEVSRPTAASTLANARQFCEFLSARWRHEPPKPAYLPDVAACELAMLEVRNMVQDHEQPPNKGGSYGRKGNIRRRRGVIALRCAYDIRSIFARTSGEVMPPKRDVAFAVTLPCDSSEVRILELAPAACDLLARLDDWVDPRTLDAIGEQENLVSYLAVHALIEVTEVEVGVGGPFLREPS
ncbi:MAG TPA: hypothetical protein VN975_13640 [Xanthobacteraceae bacterium]|jgi:hypothetical protein|nr:hypothetical protein [Xanthobacteraceae bacterium]